MNQFKKWLQEARPSLCHDYFEFLRFSSISTDASYAQETVACAKWLKNYLLKYTSLRAKLIETVGYPIVYGEDLGAGPQAPTFLFYGHYDVQPVDPLELWESPPFEPTERDGKIYARGAVDDKGQIFYTLAALRAWKELGKKLPCNLKLCIEGEEESSSKGLTHALGHLKELFKADELLVIDFDQYDPHTPAISLGARGLVSFEVTLTGSNSDLHSGVHGGMAYNPNRALAELLAKVFDEKTGKIQIDGFYDEVIEEKTAYDFPYDEESYRKEFGVDAIGGEKGRSLAEKNGLRPTFEINGIMGGYTGPGFKTVIPAKAIAKISCRLVPNQDPQKIGDAVALFLKKKVASGMKIEVKLLSQERAYLGSADSQLAHAISQAAEEVTGKSCKKMVSGGSIPIVAAIVRELKCSVLGMGYGLATDNIHAPNEHFDWDRFEKGFLTVARGLELI